MSVTCGCGTTVPDGSQFCPKCGKQVGQPSAPVAGSAPAGGGVASAQGLTQNVAGGLAYITFIPAIIFLMIEPYNKNSFVRFHSWQSIFLAVASVVVKVAMMILVDAVGFLGFLGSIALGSLVSLLIFVLWLVCLIKAFQGQTFKIPFLGDLAQQQANK